MEKELKTQILFKVEEWLNSDSDSDSDFADICLDLNSTPEFLCILEKLKQKILKEIEELKKLK